jgi:hypothetical protein
VKTEVIDGKTMEKSDFTNVGNGLIGNGGIRVTAMYLFITAILVWLSIIGTLGVKDNWDKNRGAETVDVRELNLIKKADNILAGNKSNID